MKVWITGGRGFIGRHVASRAALRGEEVVGIGHGAWDAGEYSAAGLVDWLNADVSAVNLDVLAARNGVPDAIVHLAGGSAVGPSFSAPAEDFRRSVGAAVEVLEWVRQHAPVARVVLASSAAVYGAGHDSPIREDVACVPYSPYGYHKRMAELAAESYCRGFGVSATVVRLFSVYGPGIRKQLLWDACTRLSRGENPLRLGGSGQELRDWLHVDDAARLLLHGLELASPDCPAMNGGTGNPVAVKEVVEHLANCYGHGLSVVFSGVKRAGDPERLIANVEKANGSGWHARVGWMEGLAQYVDWFRRQAGAST